MIWQRANRTFAALFEFMVPVTSALSKDLIDENTRRDTERRLRRLYLRAFAVSGFLSISAAAVLYVIAPYIVHLWLNSEIDDEVTLLIRLFCPAIAAIGLVRPGYRMLNGLGRPHLNTIFRLSNLAAVYVILGILWVNGLVLEDFAIAQSGATILYAAAFVTFMEMIIWRNWIGRRKNLARPNPAKDTGDE
jgi:O-antigen/teichoic acid export membrane protein